jgi:hypothetical protein
MRKVELQGEAFTRHIERAGTGYHLAGYTALQGGRIDEQYESKLVDDAAAQRGITDGTLAVDTRLRDALRALRLNQGADQGRRFSLPSERTGSVAFLPATAAEEAAYAVEAAVLSEADAVRIQRRLDAFEQRLLSLE